MALWPAELTGQQWNLATKFRPAGQMAERELGRAATFDFETSDVAKIDLDHWIILIFQIMIKLD